MALTACGIHGAAYAKIERARDVRWSTLVDTARALGGRLTIIYEHPDRVAQSVVETAWESLLWLDPDDDHKAARYDDLARAIRDGFAPTYTLRSVLGALLRPAVTLSEDEWTNAMGMAMETAAPEATELGEDRNVISIRVQEDGARLAIRYRLHELALVLASVGPEVLPALDLIASGDLGLRRAPDPAPGEPMAVWDPVIAELPGRDRGVRDGVQRRRSGGARCLCARRSPRSIPSWRLPRGSKMTTCSPSRSSPRPGTRRSPHHRTAAPLWTPPMPSGRPRKELRDVERPGPLRR